ncbi:hypothetical protein HQN64_01830 [Enterobacteriaceae bacterium BIT-l23]|uniref:hypothetical protein n=1 Tax=Jejubacter sp. L23 TaxID=3092086 RepID=UPI0015848D64|nr:hypothetical protein [Enterobacteriaceae bacterium BIT-l23]
MAGIASSINNAIYNSSAPSSSEAKFSRKEMELLVDVVNHLHEDELQSFANDDVDLAMRTYETLLTNSTAGSHQMRTMPPDEEQHLQSRINPAITPGTGGFFNQFSSGNLNSWNPLRVRDVYNKTTRDYLWEILSPLGSLLSSGGAIAAVMREISVRVALASAGASSVMVGAFLILRSRYKDNQVRLNKKLMVALKSLSKARIDLKKSYAKVLTKLNGDLGSHVEDSKKKEALQKLHNSITPLDPSGNMIAFLSGAFADEHSSDARIMVSDNSWHVEFGDSNRVFTMKDIDVLEMLA